MTQYSVQSARAATAVLSPSSHPKHGGGYPYGSDSPLRRERVSMEKGERAGKTGLDRVRSRGSEISKSSSSYADGAPLDRVQFLEAKLILKPDRFKFGRQLP